VPKRIEVIPGTVKYGLTFLHDVESAATSRKGLFKCKCGNEKVMPIYQFRHGEIKTCGCEWHTIRITHGHCTNQNKQPTSLYRRWNAMKYRCDNPNSADYPRYGGRGITVCKAWQKFEGFLQWATAVGYMNHLQLDRKDNNKGYSPDNCRWVTINIQAANKNKESNKMFKYRGIRQLPSGNWHVRIDVNSKALYLGTFPTEQEALIARTDYITQQQLPHTIEW